MILACMFYDIQTVGGFDVRKFFDESMVADWHLS
jgi:hypothetical protein